MEFSASGSNQGQGFGPGGQGNRGSSMWQQAAGGTLVSQGAAFTVTAGNNSISETALKDASYVLLAGDPVGSSGVSCKLASGSTTVSATSAGSTAQSSYAPADALTTNETATFEAKTTSGVDATYSGGSTPATSSKVDLSTAVVSAIAKKAYTGSAIKPKPTVTVNGIQLERGTDYTLSYKSNKKVGTATVTITAAEGSTKYTGSTKVTFKIVKAKNTMSVIAGAPTTKAGKTVKAIYVANAKGAVTYTRVSGSKYLTVGANGKIKVAAGAPAGKYTVKVKVCAAGTSNYKAKTVTKKVKVTVQ